MADMEVLDTKKPWKVINKLLNFWKNLWKRDAECITSYHSRKIFQTDCNKINKIHRRMDVVNGNLEYICSYFGGACVQTYMTKDNLTEICFHLGTWNTPKYFKEAISDYLIEVKPFKTMFGDVDMDDYTCELFASCHSIDFKLKTSKPGIAFMDSYEQLKMIKDNQGLIKRVKAFVKEGRHLDPVHECYDSHRIMVDISHI